MPTGIILAYSIPDGAQVFIDGFSAPTSFGYARTPAMISGISADTHNVTFRLPGYIDETKTISVPQGGYTSVTGILRPITK